MQIAYNILAIQQVNTGCKVRVL